MPTYRERLFAGASHACAALVVAAPLSIVLVLLWSALQPSGQSPETLGGTLQIVGRLLSATAVAGMVGAIVGGGIGVACAVAAEELATGAIRVVLLAAIAALAVTPAIVFGWAAAAFVVPLERSLIPQSGQWFVASATVLAAMAVPTSCALATRALRRVPNRQREAAVAAGADKVRTVGDVVVPAIRGRIVAALVAAFARAIGEATALQVLFVWLRPPSGDGMPLVAPWMLSLSANAAWGSLHVEAAAALALLLVVAAAALYVDREFGGLQWA